MSFPIIPDFHPVANPGAIVTAKNVRFTVLADRLIRLEYSKNDQFEDRPSQAFWYRDQPVPNFKKTVTDSSVEIETDFLLLKYQVNKKGFTHKTLTVTLKQNSATWKYCARQINNLKGTTRTLDMAAAATKLEDGLLSKSGWAVVDDSKSLVFNESGWLALRKVQQKDLYFFGYGSD